MNPSLITFKEDYQELLLSFLWRQWAALGVAGHGSTNDPWAIDPEALLLFSCTLARYEARLFDEILDWTNTNGDAVNIQRLRTMSGQRLFAGQDVLSAVAGLMAVGRRSPKWKNLARLPENTKEAQPLFFHKSGEPMESFGNVDEDFKRYGFLRGKVELRGHTQPVRVIRNTGMIFKLRYLWGINARCEIILYLLIHDGGHPRKISRDICYFQKTVQDTLVDMARSDLVYVRPVGKEKHYWLKTDKWLDFLSGDSSQVIQWVNWPMILSALEEIWLKLSQGEFRQLSPLAQSSELRALMQKVRPKIEAAGFARALSDEKMYLGEDYTRVFLSDIGKLLGKDDANP
jgi:hypothetical protein